MDFSTREVRDLAVAWAVLSLAFTFLFVPPMSFLPSEYALFVRWFVLSLVTVGVGFLLHELAHKVVAVRFGQTAAFRADYGMLGLAVVAALAGFLFAAPGAVVHSGYVTERENGLIAVAGPITNVVLAVLFAPVFFIAARGGFLWSVGQIGLIVNAGLAVFNMIPFGPLDGRKVVDWSVIVFGLVLLGCLFVGAAAFVVAWPPVLQ